VYRINPKAIDNIETTEKSLPKHEKQNPNKLFGLHSLAYLKLQNTKNKSVIEYKSIRDDSKFSKSKLKIKRIKYKIPTGNKDIKGENIVNIASVLSLNKLILFFIWRIAVKINTKIATIANRKNPSPEKI